MTNVTAVRKVEEVRGILLKLPNIFSQFLHIDPTAPAHRKADRCEREKAISLPCIIAAQTVPAACVQCMHSSCVFDIPGHYAISLSLCYVDISRTIFVYHHFYTFPSILRKREGALISARQL